MNDTTVNSQVTDSVTQTDTIVVGSGPALSTGELMQLTAQSLALAAHNATGAQQHNTINAHASATMGIKHIYAANKGKDVQKILTKGTPDKKQNVQLKGKGYVPYPLMYPKYP